MATEKRLIDAIKFEKLVHNHRATYLFKEDILAAIAKQPTVDAVEVVRGQWITNDFTMDCECSICGCTFEWWEDDEAHYCPNCGAKMDGDGNA